MPNRILRDWTDSEKMDMVSFQAEVLFTRIMMKADDYGSFHANPKLINSFCFPLKNIRETDITRWLQELVSAGLIALYSADNKRYLNILNFRQRLRIMKPAYPLYDISNTYDGHTADIRPHEEEEETEEETEEIVLSADAEQPTADFLKFKDWIKANTPNVLLMKEQFTQDQFVKAKNDYGHQKMAETLIRMHNWKDLSKKNVSAYLTMINWIKREK